MRRSMIGGLLAAAAVLVLSAGLRGAQESDELIRLRAENKVLRATIKRLAAEAETLRKDLADLKRRLPPPPTPPKPPAEASKPAPKPAPAPGADFFGVKTTGKKIVYVVDRSGSMTDTLKALSRELKRSIGKLAPEVQFHVIFYSSGPPTEMPPRKLAAATDANKKRGYEFIDGIISQGETDPSRAIDRAFAVGPDTIYLLSDGEFDRAIIGRVKKLNANGKVTVHTICFFYRTGETLLKAIAAQNGGQYKFVSEADLAKLGK